MVWTATACLLCATFLLVLVQESTVSSFVLESPSNRNSCTKGAPTPASHHRCRSLPLLVKTSQEEELEKTFGGYTVKQRLREEVESPFRTVRLWFFGSSTGSALVALYFSLLTTGKAFSGGYADIPPVEETLQNVAINVGAVVVCAALTWRDWQAGEANLARIKQGGALAKLVVQQIKSEGSPSIATLADYRRNARVLIAAGGKKYIEELCRSLSADQLKDSNNLAQSIEDAELIVVPVLLEGDSSSTRVGDTVKAWNDTTAVDGTDRNFDTQRCSDVVAFPRGATAWAEVLEPEMVTARGQGFDVLEKGITLILKKNGKILRRATGQPQWGGLLGTMEVLDGSKFGMPGDDDRYGDGKRPSV